MPSWMRFLGYVQLLAAGVGLFGLGGYATGQAGFLQTPTMWLGLAFQLLVGIAGVWLLLGYRRGLQLSLAAQLMSAIAIKGSFGYAATAGPFGAIIIASSGFGAFAGAYGRFGLMESVQPTLEAPGSGFQLNIGFWPDPLRDAAFAVSLNVAAAWFVVLLWQQLRATRPRELTTLVTDSGSCSSLVDTSTQP